MKTLFDIHIGKTIIALALIATIGGVGIPSAAQASLTESQVNAITTLLESFGADPTTINNVRSALTGVTLTETNDNVVSCDFTRSLYPEMSGTDVLCLQQYLNAAGHLVATNGAGSIGNETEYYGSLTTAAVKSWQDANGVSYGNWGGYFGSVSQTKYDALVAAGDIPLEELQEPITSNIASISASNLESSAITQNASNFKLLEVKFDGNKTINSLSVKRIGWSTNSDYVNNGVYLYKDGTRLAEVRSFNYSDSTATFKNLNLTAPFTLAVMADFVGTVGHVVKIELNGDYVGLPLQSNEFNFVSVKSGEISFEYSGSVDDPVVGQRNALISKFKIINVVEEDEVSETATIKHIELYNSGNNVLSNVKISDRDNTFSGTIENDRLVFDINTEIKSGKSKTFEVYADIDGREGDIIKLYVYNSYDVQAIGNDYDLGVTVDISSFSGDKQVLTLVESGELTVRSRSTDDVMGYWGQFVSDVAKFRFKADDSEGFFIDELRFRGSNSTEFVAGIEELTITYKNRFGNILTASETVDYEVVSFDSFTSNNRPYVARGSNMEVLVGLTLRNDEDTIRLDDHKIILDSFVATGGSSDEEIEELDVNRIAINGVSSNAATISLSKEGTVELYPLNDIEFSIMFNSDDRISAFTSSTGSIYMTFKHSTSTDSSLIGDLTAEIYANNVLVKTIEIVRGTTEAQAYLTTEEEGTLEILDGDEVDIRIEFHGEDSFYFSSPDDRLTVVIKDVTDQITWIDDFDGELEEKRGNVRDLVESLPLRFIYNE